MDICRSVVAKGNIVLVEGVGPQPCVPGDCVNENNNHWGIKVLAKQYTKSQEEINEIE